MAGELEGATGEHLSGEHGGTPMTAWVSVIALVIGFALMCLALPWQAQRLPLLIVGGVIGLIGIVLAKTSNMMENVE